MVASDEYSHMDGWPAEGDRPLYFKVNLQWKYTSYSGIIVFIVNQAVLEVPLQQEALTHLFLIGISKSNPLNGREVIDLAEILIRRAAALHALDSEDFRVLRADHPKETIDYLTNLAAYR